MGLRFGCSVLALMASADLACAQQALQEAQRPAAPVTEAGAKTTILDPIVVKAPPTLARGYVAVRPAATAPLAARSGGGNSAGQVGSFDALVTSTDKTESTIYDAPATVSARSAAELERQNINSPRDLARDEPGVSVGNQPGRTGATNYVIRGIGENRVRLEVDGYKIPDFPQSNAGAGTYTRDFFDFDTLKRVEIIRGPASALYGSDAIGGVVSYVTKDPSDYLNLVKKDTYASAKLGYDSQDQSLYETLTGAARYGGWEAMVLYTHRNASEVDINSDVRSSNPQKVTADNILGKLINKSKELGEFKLTVEHLEKNVVTRILSEEIITPGGPFSGPGSRVFFSKGDDTTTRERVSLDWKSAPINGWLADTIKTKTYATEVTRQELSTLYRAGSAAAVAPTQLRLTDLRYDQTIVGGEIQASVLRKFWGFDHDIIYGGTVDLTQTSRPRNRTQTNLTTGAVTNVVNAETFPNKNFPDTDTGQYAAYFQDTAKIGALRIIPAVRFDYYQLTPKPDALFANSNTKGFTIGDQDAFAVSPKLGATYDLTENYRLFGQYAKGFRAPPYDNANFGFSNPVFMYEILPNGDLRPETSNGFEAGIRARFVNGSSFQLSAFYNQYEDFLDTVVLNITPQGFTTFQYKNIANVTIFGFEGKGEWKFKPEWALFGSFAYARGINEVTGRALDSVDPLTLIGGIRYRGVDGFGGELRARWIADKNQVSQATYLTPEGHTTIDALLSCEIVPNSP